MQLEAIRRDEPAFSGGSEPRSRGAVYTEPAQAVGALLREPTLVRAAERVGVSERTLRRPPSA